MLTNNLAIPAQLRPEAAISSSHHAVRYRLQSGQDVRTLLDQIEVALRRPGESAPAIEIERHAFASGAPQADQLRRREISTLPASTSRLGIRGHVLAWADGVFDLILVGRLGSPDEDALRQFLGQASAPQAPRPRAVMDDTPLPQAQWGLGGDAPREGRSRIDHLQLAADADFTLQVAAIGLALSRFEGKRRLAIAVFGHPAFPAAILGDCAGQVRLVEIDLDRATDVRQLMDAVARQLSDGPVVPLDKAAELSLVGVTGPVLHALPNGAAYQAHVQPPFAFTVGISPGVGDCWTDVDTRRVSPDMARTVVRVADGMARHMKTLLATAPESTPDAIPWLDAGHAAEVVAIGRSRPLPVRSTAERIEESIARHAASQPDRIAVTCEDRHLDYRTLHDLAGRIATVLAELGVREGDFVGILIERQLELVPVLLGVLRAGAAYVPIDPAYPQNRITYTLGDAAPAVVVCASAQPDVDGPGWITLDELLARAATATPRTEPVQAGADGDAYVIYTSGSTGRPKGVVVPHRNVVALIDATRDDFGLGASDTWTLFHSTAFDFSVWEIWGCLATGARLVVVPYWVTRSPDSFHALLDKEQVTVLNQTPSAFTQLVDLECHTGQPPSLALRLVIFGGEALDCRPLTRWFDRYPESVCRLVNMFGITETTVHVTAETITRAHALTRSRAVGPAIPGWHLCVLDEALRLVPTGVVGEIHVTGAGVAREYLNRHDLTAQRFIPDVFTGSQGRMYRSGDLGRLRHDGRLEHLGRIDSQVKIRGFRIELDEIRAVLLEYPEVTGAAVVVNRTDPDDEATARIDAYVVVPNPDFDALRRHLERALPVHMLPATITSMPALPMTANGKLDTGRLAPPQLRTDAPAAQPTVAQTQACAPEAAADAMSSFERELLEIWSELLGTPVGLDDNFFELGGNSLYAVRLSAAMRKRSLPPVPSRDLYIHQTVRRIAQKMTETSSGAEKAHA